MYVREKDREKEREVDPFPFVFVEACISLFPDREYTGIGVPILFCARYSSTTVCVYVEGKVRGRGGRKGKLRYFQIEHPPREMTRAMCTCIRRDLRARAIPLRG